MKRLLLILVLAAAAIGGWLLFRGPSTQIYRFEGVEGPDEATPVAPPHPTKLEDYDRGGSNRLAVLVTDPKADWIGLVRGFKAHGIPFTLTRSPERALRHKVVLAYPIISGRVLAPEAIRGLADHVRGGGTLLTFDLAGGGLEKLFGISGQFPSRGRSEIRWLGDARAPEDRLTRFSGPRAEVREGSYGIVATTAERVANFDDGSAAATCRTAGGKACLLGVDLGGLTQRAMNGRAEQVSATSANGYDPSLDLMYRWVRELYVAGETKPFLIGTAPAGAQGSLILTHDIDYTRSVANMPLYAEAIRRRKLSATFFIQTKVVRDWNDDVFFNSDNLPPLRATADGMEIGSHSVSHARTFASFPMGSGTERYPDYRPFVQSATETRDGTILGELRVSRFLLENMLGADISSFRPGYLADPQGLPEAMAATGYRHASTLTANVALTHLPFQLTHARAGAALLPVWEFPVTIEDERPPRLDRRFDAAVGVVERIAGHGGVAVILIHPDITGYKLAFEERLIDRFLGKMWIGSVEQFGRWWTARDRAELDYDGTAVSVNAPERIENLVILFPKSGRSLVIKGSSGERRISVSP